ncbi:hypothetical protein, variant [Sphaeroforma arctica JP610]|uniref:Uncharacterized protein n=1 Tax=Sphaeroforma arctica JP610 TaxID=667725 RepID=A0A0L0G4C4_9EUKA|nr:hypothetical protein, variant [Sphaeroforma arctica JP610]KNC83666.1 hypothetical protein, variant [Sphaeroforma arctica JP610]|eukprot:XP_014157568.1 hypothetical protein, variant [Sphaeroforma arctica JP610]
MASPVVARKKGLSISVHKDRPISRSEEIANKRRTQLLGCESDDFVGLSSVSSFTKAKRDEASTSSLAVEHDSKDKRKSWMSKFMTPNTKRKSAAMDEWFTIDDTQQRELVTDSAALADSRRKSVVPQMNDRQYNEESTFTYTVTYVGYGEVPTDSRDMNNACRKALSRLRKESDSNDDISKTEGIAGLSPTQGPTRNGQVTVQVSLKGVKLTYIPGPDSPTVSVQYPLCHVALSLMEQSKKTAELRMGIVFWDARVKREYVLVFKGEHTAAFNVALRWAFHLATTKSKAQAQAQTQKETSESKLDTTPENATIARGEV